MKIFEIGTGYTSIPAKVGAATEIVVEELVNSFLKIDGVEPYIIDIKDKNRKENNLPIIEVYMPQFFSSTDTSLGIVHKLKRVLYSISLSYKLWGIIKKSKEEVILHFHNQYNYFFFHKIVPKKIRNRCKTLYTVHSYIWFNVWNEIDEIVKKRYFQEIFSVKNADKIFVLNNTTKNHFVEKLNIEEESIVKIPNGVNTSIYKPLEKDQIDLLKKQNGLSGKKIFLQVGSVCERKNQLGALSLLQSLLVENKNCVFAYAGGIIDQEYQNKIKEFSKENNINEQVVYLGELSPGSKLNEYYNIAESLVFCSRE